MTFEKPTMAQPSLTHLLALLAARGTSTTPLLVDHSTGHRIELSGRVLVNWWAKNVGLLDMEFGLSEGDRIFIDAPPHWRTLPIILGALSLGATVCDEPAEADLVITTQPAQHMEAPEVLAVTLEALAMDFPAELPSGMVDHAAEIRAQPDALMFSEASASQAGWELADVDATGVAKLADSAVHDAAASSVSWLAVASATAERRQLDADWTRAVAALLACQPEGSLVLVSQKPSENLIEQERISRPAWG